MYRIYAQHKITSWEKIDITDNKEKAFEIAEKINAKDYYSYLIIHNNGNGDEVIHRKDFSRECAIEFVDKVNTKVEIKATIFKPSRAKRKQEERRLFKEYFKNKSRDYREDDYLNC